MRAAPRLLLAMTMTAIGGTPDARAQEAAYAVSYVEAAATSKDAAATALGQLAALGRQAEGNLSFEVLRNRAQPQHFVVVEAWKGQKARELYAGSPQVKQARESLEPLLTSPCDERLHVGFAVGPTRQAPLSAEAVFVVTHVDFVPWKKDEGMAALNELVDRSRGESGNMRFDALQQTNLPNHFTLVEVWTDPKALDAHGQTAHTKKFRQQLQRMIGSPYDERLNEILNSGAFR